jgi:hypothetical protein
VLGAAELLDSRVSVRVGVVLLILVLKVLIVDFESVDRDLKVLIVGFESIDP